MDEDQLFELEYRDEMEMLAELEHGKLLLLLRIVILGAFGSIIMFLVKIHGK